MDTFKKITAGFVVQTFQKADAGRFVCAGQAFVAGDQCDYEDGRGNPIEPPNYEHQPYLMRQGNETTPVARPCQVRQAIEGVLQSLDVGGEQSRRFAEEIAALRDIVSRWLCARDITASSEDVEVWVAAVTYEYDTIRAEVVKSRHKAIEALARYLRTHEGYIGPAEMSDICDWMTEYNERFGIDLFSATLDLS